MTQTKIHSLIAMAWTLALCSCFSMKCIHGNTPLSREAIQSLKLNTLYEFSLRSGQKQLITLTDNRNDTISGYYAVKDREGEETKTSYSSSYDDVMKHVLSISARKVNVAATITASALAYAAVFTIIYIVIQNSDACFICWNRVDSFPIVQGQPTLNV